MVAASTQTYEPAQSHTNFWQRPVVFPIWQREGTKRQARQL
jgi:hypothetical protein